MNNRSSLTYSETLFRPLYELNSAYVYIGAGVATGFISQVSEISSSSLNTPTIIAGGLIGVGLYKILCAYPKMRQQLKLFINKLEFIDIDVVRYINKWKFNSKSENFKYTDKREIYIGNGFEWGPQHAQRAYQIMDLSVDLREMEIPFALKPIVLKYRKHTKNMGGRTWIHAIGEEKPQIVNEDTFYGHSFITGVVGSGKTTLLRLLGTGFLHMGNSIVVIDPKDDKHLKEGLRSEAKALGIGHKFYEFCPARPSESCAIDILKNFAIPSEIPTRIASLLKSGSGATDSFIEFGWQTISQVTDGMIFCSESPKLTEIYRYMRSGKTELLEKVLSKFYELRFGQHWKQSKLSQMEGLGDSTLEGMHNYYTQNIPSKEKNATVDDVIQFVTHNHEHAQKMLASVFPLFKVLCSNPLDKLLSPTRGQDDIEIIDIKRVIMDGGIIYCALNSMNDPRTAGHLAKLLLADISSCLGDRYNYGTGEERRVSILVDEVHAAVAGNDSLINNLAQGRAAKCQFVLSTQTIPDLIDMTDQATADRYLGLCNNFFSLKVTDIQTQEYVAKQFSQTNISDVGVQYSIQSATGQALSEFSGGYKENITKTREDMFPTSLIGDLPKLQYVARLSNGQKLKCKLPIIRG
ncbi:conjugative transfer system coupling protein TraD [Shewanella sp. SG44-6]|uniref:conjugative transfer system coupling protein TraD n=1 Tax=Shewanella sp. SG44-6 TaxID=2760959 RepID=UPI00160245EA|nr:conjugative transfer system coupling protein TraD [Shewanella sp. SG44-6]MBB1388353.1 conjugative transfer system coupling protein TraD [Shewanella sp. SG44-6]|tara:strand:- start:7572 stop:9476 length:1905 start_codon:yes stop_codon:yes gene_type:complete